MYFSEIEEGDSSGHLYINLETAVLMKPTW
jgi:hypothetical protein